ncbi:unnamed protein product [Gadus morhua 'NCC']
MYSIWVCLKDDHYKLASVDLSHPDMLTITFLALLITLNDVSGASLSDQVHQTPPEIVVAIESGPTVTLECSHSIKNYDQILCEPAALVSSTQTEGHCNPRYKTDGQHENTSIQHNYHEHHMD